MDSWISAIFKVRISGMIGATTLKKLNRDLERNKFYKPLALALCVNSPGGSPAYSSIIRQRILAYANRHEIPVIAFAEDVAASGGYYILTAGDELYASENSLIGSIGARFDFFSLKALANSWGIERREWGSPDVWEQRVDPLKDLNPATQKWMQQLLHDTREEFARVVEESRGDKLKGKKEDLFNADVFSGTTATNNGLIDQIGLCDEIIKQKYPLGKITDISREGKLDKIKDRLERFQDFN